MENLKISDLQVIEELNQDELSDIHGGIDWYWNIDFESEEFSFPGLGSFTLGFGFGDSGTF